MAHLTPAAPTRHGVGAAPPGNLITHGGGVLLRGRTPVRSGGRKRARSQLFSRHMQLIKQGGKE